MGKLEDLRAGVAEMRSVAQRLLTWAEDMEASLLRREETPPPAREDMPAEKKKTAESKKKSEPALSLPQVREMLAEKCAAGFAAQVKALIESCGVSSLREVPAEKYEMLVKEASLLGSGGEADAG